MKRLLLAATSVLLILPDIAAAQQPPQRPAPGRPTTKPARPGGPAVQPPRPGRPQVQPPRPGNPGANRPLPPHRPGYRPPNFRPLPAPVFRYPRGYRYQRWAIGARLPWIFVSNGYYYNNFAALHFGPPPPGTRWVRYGPDLLLVRGRDARILDVIYGAFR